MPLWLLLADKAKGYALELHPAPIQWGRPPRPFSPGPEGENFTDFDLRWLSDTPSKNAQTWGNRWREPLDKNDPLQRSALKSGALAYRLLYHSVDNPLRQQCTVRFQLDEAELLAQGGGRGISGESGDLLFALAVVTVSQPRSGGYPPLAATGVLDEAGRVKYVTGVADKLKAYLTAIANLPETTQAKTDGNSEQTQALFFYPRANDDDLNPELRKTAHQAGVRLIAVESLEEALCALGITVKDYWEGNPYRGFGFFDTAHRRIFFGRETESAIVCEKLLQREKNGTPGILVMASSGRGKSSLVRAGVIPHLQKHEALLERPIFHRVCRLPQDIDKNDPAASEAALVNALRQDWAKLPELQHMEVTQDHTSNADTLSALADELSQVLPEARRFVWVIDPMEELFTCYPAATVEAFGTFLKRLQTLGVWPIATLRSEYGHDYQNTNLLDVFGDAHILPKMHETLLEQAIRGPAKLAKLDFETDPATGINLAAHIRDEALQGGEDMLPLLGFVMSELYEDPDRIKHNDGWLRWEAYRRLGGLPDASQQPQEQPSTGKPDQKPSRFSLLLSRLRRRENAQPRPPLISTQAHGIGGLPGAISHHAEKLLASCTPQEQAALPVVLLQLVHLSEEGNQVQRQRARMSVFADDPDQLSLTRKLIDGRLLVSHTDPQTQDAQVELVHDCLLTAWNKVGEAIEQHRELLEEKRKLSNAARHWERNGKPERLLIDKANEVIKAEVLVTCCKQNSVDSFVTEYLSKSLWHTRTNIRALWVLLNAIGAWFILWLLYDLVSDYASYDLYLNIFILTCSFIVLSPVFFKGIRSIFVKPYLVTAKTDIFIKYIYVFTIAVPAYVMFNMDSIIKGDFSIEGYVEYVLLIIFPAILSIRSALLQRRALLAANNKILLSYGASNKNNFLPAFISWRNFEILVWFVILVTIFSEWNDWRHNNVVIQRLKSFVAVDLVYNLQANAEDEFKKNNTKNGFQYVKSAIDVLNYTRGYNFEILKWVSSPLKHFNNENNALRSTIFSLKNCMLYLVSTDTKNAKYYCDIPNENVFTMWITADTPKNRNWIELSVFCAYVDNMLALYKTSKYPMQLDKLNQYQILIKSEHHLNTLIKEYYKSLDFKTLRSALLYLRCKYALLKKIAYINNSNQNFNLSSQNLEETQKVLNLIHELALKINSNANSLQDIQEEDKFELYNGKDYIDKNARKQLVEISTADIVGDLIKEFLEAQNIVKIRETGCDYSAGRVYGFKSYLSILEKDYKAALSYADRALQTCPNEFWIKAKKAHALMLSGNTEEAKIIYLENINLTTDWELKQMKSILLDDFKDFKSFDITHPMISEISSIYKSN